MARESDRGRTLRLLAALSREKGCWRWFLEFDVAKFASKFPPGVPYAVIPVGEIFAAVYRECQKVYAGDEPDEPKKVRRAQS